MGAGFGVWVGGVLMLLVFFKGGQGRLGWVDGNCVVDRVWKSEMRDLVRVRTLYLPVWE